MPDANRFHPSLEGLPQWQLDYIAEFKRTTGHDAGFEKLAGGWFSLKTLDEIGCVYENKVRMKEVLGFIEKLKQRPDAKKKAKKGAK